MRDVIQTDFLYAFEPAVGIYIDDIYHGTLTGSSGLAEAHILGVPGSAADNAFSFPELQPQANRAA